MNEPEMVPVVSYVGPSGGSIEIVANKEDAWWLRILFRKSPNPFEVLRQAGVDVAMEEE